jgi:hypothetical protein
MVPNCLREALAASAQLPSRVARSIAPWRRTLHIIGLLVAIVAAGYVSVRLGKDANWDLQNYHFYNGYAFVEGRLDHDLAPAQLQSFHSPLLDAAFYLMVRADWAPRVIAVVLALPAGIGAYLIALITLRLFPGGFGEQFLLRGAAIAIACTGTMAIALLGTTMNEWPCAALVMAALWLLLVDADQPQRPARRLVLSGIVAGVAAGLKLTAAPYAVGLCCALAAQSSPLRRRVIEAAGFGSAVVAGLLLSSGFWFYELWQRFNNPVFPYLNAWFRSPWFDAVDFPPRGYGPHSLVELMTFPFWLLKYHASLITEMYLRDWRLAILYVVALALLATTLYRRLRRPKLTSVAGQLPKPVEGAAAPGAWRLVCVFWIVSFAIWVYQHSNYRFVIPLELLMGPLIVGALQRTISRRLFAAFAAVATAALVILTARYPDWGHINFQRHYFYVEAPPLPERSMVILVGGAPMAYVIPFMRNDARFVGLNNNLTELAFHNHRYQRLVDETIDQHRGPLFSMSPTPDAETVLRTRGLSQDRAGCELIRSNMPTSPIELCPLLRAGSQERRS